MAFVTNTPYAPGDLVEIDCTTLGHQATITGEVIWSDTSTGGRTHTYANGIRFLDTTMFSRARVVEQVCRIERYRQAQQERHGRTLSSEQAAEEWITKLAHRFP